jgi:hypothetical protein
MAIKINEKLGTYEYLRYMRDGSTKRCIAVIRSRSAYRKTRKTPRKR